MFQYFVHLFLLYQVLPIGGVFFHERSHVVLKPVPDGQESFGFSLAYQNKSRTLVTGAPHSSRTGKVFKCPLSEVLLNKTIKCQEAVIDVDSLAPYDSELAPSLKLNLGVSVSATDDYFYTCAPLWYRKVHMKEEEYATFPVGACFMHNGTAYLSNTIVDEEKQLTPARILGGFGWRTLIDQNWLLVAKVSPKIPSITFMNATDTLNTATLLTVKKKTSPKRSRDRTYLNKFRNVGFAITSGKFFGSDIVYAISGLNESQGIIHFIAPASKKNKQLYLLESSKINEYVCIVDTGPMGSMFGAAMCSANLNFDEFSELLVGAPTYVDGGYEIGALHIYLGGEKVTCNTFESSLNTMQSDSTSGSEPISTEKTPFQNKTDTIERHKMIVSNYDGSRFGTAIASSDLDGDDLSEIFVSAPYENSGEGVVYIFSGYEINKKLITNGNVSRITVSELELTQRIQNNAFKTFGYSLLVIPDVDGNKCDELAVGSPGNQNIMILRCVPSVNVTVQADLVGNELKLDDMNFTMRVCVSIKDVKNRSLDLLLTLKNDVEGNGVAINNNQTVINMLGKSMGTPCVDVLLEVDKYPGDYVFRSRVIIDESDILNAADFDLSWAVVSPYSELEIKKGLSRRCKDLDCNPKFAMQFNWSGGDIINGSSYLLGSSESLTASLMISNEGNSSWEACALVRVSGATVAQFGCIENEGQYKCLLPKGLRQNMTHQIDIKLNMSQPKSVDENLDINVLLIDFCEKPNSTNTNITEHLRLNLNNEDILLHASVRNQEISDTNIQEQSSGVFKDFHEYWVINKGNQTIWTGIVAEVVMYKQPFISSNRVFNWPGIDYPNRTVFSNTFDLLPGTGEKIIASFDIKKDKIMENLISNKLTVQSSILIHLYPTSRIIEKRLSSTITLRKEKHFKHDKNLIFLVAIVVGMVILVCIILLLYKMHFFKRPEKENLEHVKEEIVRRQSVAAIQRSMSIENQGEAESTNASKENRNTFSPIQEEQTLGES